MLLICSHVNYENLLLVQHTPPPVLVTMPTGCLPDAENVKFSKYIVEESRLMGDCSEVETLHLIK